MASLKLKNKSEKRLGPEVTEAKDRPQNASPAMSGELPRARECHLASGPGPASGGTPLSGSPVPASR